MDGRMPARRTVSWIVGIVALAMAVNPFSVLSASGSMVGAEHSPGARGSAALVQEVTSLQCDDVPPVLKPPGTTIKATLRGPDGSPLAGRQIQWSDEPGFASVIRKVSTTNASGVATTEYIFPFDSGSSGSDAVTARFEGDGEYQASECTVRFRGESPALPTPTPRAAACPDGQPSPTSAECSIAWTAQPPTPGAPATCPAADQWLLLYWSGSNGAAIKTAATGCDSADRVWARQGTQWLAFSAANPVASDEWSLQRGEAAFMHGRAGS